MSFYAVEELSESLDDSKDFLLPFRLKDWVRLALIVFFAGGIGSMGATDFTGVMDDGPEGVDFEAVSIPNVGTGFVVAIALIAISFVLLFSYLGAVFEFIFYQSLENREPRIRPNFAEHYGNGFKYFLFNWSMLLAWFLTIGVIIAAFSTSLALGAVLLLLMLPVWLALWVLSFLVGNITVPDMVVEGSGFIEGLKKAFGHLRAEIGQIVVFVFVKILLGWFISLVLLFAILGVVIVVLLPLAVLAIILGILFVPLAAIPVLLGVLVFAVAWLLILIPLSTYMYQWVLNVYKRFGVLDEIETKVAEA